MNLRQSFIKRALWRAASLHTCTVSSPQKLIVRKQTDGWEACGNWHWHWLQRTLICIEYWPLVKKNIKIKKGEKWWRWWGFDNSGRSMVGYLVNWTWEEWLKYWLIHGCAGRCALAQRPPARWHSSARSGRLYACFSLCLTGWAAVVWSWHLSTGAARHAWMAALPPAERSPLLIRPACPLGRHLMGRGDDMGGRGTVGGWIGQVVGQAKGKLAHLGRAKPPPLPFPPSYGI